MTSKQFVALGVRLFCIWLAIYILREVPAYWLAISQQRSTEIAATVVIAIMALYAVIVILLWLFPLTVARKLLPRSALDQPVALPLHEQMERTGFCLMGLWLLTRALPGFAFEAFIFDLYAHSSPTLKCARKITLLSPNTWSSWRWRRGFCLAHVACAAC